MALRVLWGVAWALAGCGPSQNGNGPLVDAALVDGASIDVPPKIDDAMPDARVVVPDAMVDAMPDAMADAMVDATVPVPDAMVDATVAGPDAMMPDAPPADAGTPDAPVTPPPSSHLRLVAGNLTSGNNQAYLTPGIHIFRGLAPDVAMIQEFNVGGNTAAEIRTFIDQGFGTDYTYVRGVASGQIPNGIVSRYPIIASGDWTDTEVGNRTFVWAQIDIPGPIDLYAISVHLLSSSPSERNIEGGELATHIQGLPAGAYVVLGGDFNTDSRGEGVVSQLSSVLVTSAPYPADQASLSNTNANRNKPYDWVLTTTNLEALESPTVVGNNTFAHGFVADTRVYTPISDLAPAVASDSGATNMQHMAVARDFTLPGGSATSLNVTAPNGGDTWTAGTSQTVRWTSTGITSVRVELSIDNGTTWTTLSASTPAAAGQLAVTAPMTATAQARVRISALPGGVPSDVSDAAFTISTLPPPVGHVLLNEVLANEPGSDTAGEFVELVNSGTGDVDLSGWTISDSVQVRHTFAAGTVLRAGRAIVVFGGATAIPAGLTNAVAASTGTLALTNASDTVTLKSPTAVVDSVAYAMSQPDGVSLNRSPDGDAAGTWVLHDTLSPSSSSPGTRVNGTGF